MDLLDFKLDEALPMTLKHPLTGEDLDVKIWLHSTSSKAARKALQAHYKKGDEEQLEDEDFIPQLITKWENVKEGGKEVKFSLEEAKRILSSQDWILTQCKIAIRTGEYCPKH